MKLVSSSRVSKAVKMGSQGTILLVILHDFPLKTPDMRHLVFH
jgi:hypothetical protein